MRTTIDLPEDLHRIALAIARETGRSLSETVADLVRRGLSSGVREGEWPPAHHVDPDTRACRSSVRAAPSPPRTCDPSRTSLDGSPARRECPRWPRRRCPCAPCPGKAVVCRGTEPFATCPITQGTLLRMLLRHGAVEHPAQAAEVLAQFCAHPRHRFWPDNLNYTALSWHAAISGQRQVTGAYLAVPARAHKGKLATLDKGLAALRPDVAVLLP